MSKQPPSAPTASKIGPCHSVIQISRTPRHCKFTQHHRTTRPPQFIVPSCHSKLISTYLITIHWPDRCCQTGYRTQGSWVRYPVWQHTFVSPSAFSRRAVVSYWRKYVHEVLVNRLGGLSLPRKSVVRLTDRPDMTLDVYRGRRTTMQCNNWPDRSATD